MKVSVPFFLSLIFDPAPVLGQQRDEVICESSEASPFMHHISLLVNKLRDEDESEDGPLCFSAQIGKKPGYCGGTIKGYSDGGGAAFQLCMTDWPEGTGDGRWKYCKNKRPGEIECGRCPEELTYSGKAVAAMIEEIAEKCNNPHRAGGRYLLRWPYGGEVRLISMPG